MLELEQPASPDSAVVDTTPPETNLGTPPDPSDDLLDGDLPQEQQAPPDDEEEDELDGVKIRGKKDALDKLKAERLMQSDYTRKTQEVAEQRRAIEAERAHFQETAQTHQQHIREVAQLVSIDERLGQFANFDFNAAADSDPVQALKLHNEYTRLQAQRGQLVNSITQKQQAQAQATQRETAKQIIEARQVLERDIKGWSPDLASKLVDYGMTQGFPREVLDRVTQPAIVKVLHKARLYDELQKQRTAKTPSAPAPPATRVSGASAVTTKPLSETSDAEFIRRRREYIAKHR